MGACSGLTVAGMAAVVGSAPISTISGVAKAGRGIGIGVRGRGLTTAVHVTIRVGVIRARLATVNGNASTTRPRMAAS